MLKTLMKYALLLALLVSGAFGAFIQSPITPHSKQNFFRDMDADGRLDQISLRFLGTMSREYLDEMVDSLEFHWLDSSGVCKRYVVMPDQMSVDPQNNRQVLIDLKKIQNQFLMLTSMSRMDYAGVGFGDATLFIADSIEFNLNMRDGMHPAISYAHLKSFRGEKSDTLSVSFTENVEIDDGCDAFVEFKSAKDSTVHILSVNSANWNYWNDQVVLEILPEKDEQQRISIRDSIRLVSGCVKDSVKNVVRDSSKFFPVTGFYPLELHFPILAVESSRDNERASQFELEFENPEEAVEDSSWKVSMEVLGPEFENALRDILGLNEKAEINTSKLRFICNVKIYTNLGSYVAGTRMSVKGGDSRLKYAPTRLSLRWNLMDEHHRYVGSGAYLSTILVAIEYEGKIIFRSDKNMGVKTRMFGVMRR